jgi:hypothetical protein
MVIGKQKAAHSGAGTMIRLWTADDYPPEPDQ